MQILTFFLKEQKYAMDINLVDTIENSMVITPVPRAKRYLIGLVSNRGAAIPVINMNNFLNENDTEEDFQKIIIINLKSEKLALAVNDIDDVFEIEEENIESVMNREDMSIIKLESGVMTLLTYKQLLNILY